MKQATWVNGVLIGLVAAVTVLGTGSMAAARSHGRDADNSAESVARALGRDPSGGGANTQRVADTNDGIVATSVSGTSLVVDTGKCGTAAYGMTLAAAGATEIGSWNGSVSVTKPDGEIINSDWFFSGSSTGSAFLCAGLDPTGTYTVNVRWTAFDPSGNIVDVGADAGTFSFSVRPPGPKAHQRLTFHKYRWGRHGWRVTGTLTRAGHVRAHVKIFVDAIAKGHGYDLFSARTNLRGIATWHFRPKKGAGRFKLALRAPEDDTSTAAWSRTFRLPYRG